MMEWMKEVMTGWPDYISHQKLMACFLALLMLFFFTDRWKKQRRYWLYGLIMTVLCLFPVSAAGLLIYQTRFYDYRFIFASLPILVYVAYGVVELFTDHEALTKLSNVRRGCLLACVILILMCCYSDDTASFGDTMTEEETAVAIDSLQKILEYETTGDVCLWAPREMMEVAREQDGSIRLLYGRNMWDNALNAYSYDEYSEEIKNCCLWMEGIHKNGRLNQKQVKGIECINAAFEHGATIVVLPGDIKQKTIRRIEKKTNTSAHPVDGYLVITK